MRTRYAALHRALDATRGRLPRVHVMEIGTYDGRNAADMLTRLMQGGTNVVEYVGFDLFEDMTAEKSLAELSKSTLPPPADRVRKYIRDHSPSHVGGLGFRSVNLFKGDTADTIPAFGRTHSAMRFDVIFQDGGHSPKTVMADWNNAIGLLREDGVYVLDDYYHGKYAGEYGCRTLVDSLARSPSWIVEVSPERDYYEHTGLTISMATVRRNPDAVLEEQGA